MVFNTIKFNSSSVVSSFLFNWLVTAIFTFFSIFSSFNSKVANTLVNLELLTLSSGIIVSSILFSLATTLFSGVISLSSIFGSLSIEVSGSTIGIISLTTPLNLLKAEVSTNILVDL